MYARFRHLQDCGYNPQSGSLIFIWTLTVFALLPRNVTVFLLRVIEGVSGTLLVYKLILLIAITDESELKHNCHDIKED